MFRCFLLAVCVSGLCEAAEPTESDRAKAVEVLTKLAKIKGKAKGAKLDAPEKIAEPLTLNGAGEVGTLPHPKVKVVEVIDKKTALIETRTNRDAGERDEDITLVVHGVNTSKWADDLSISAPACIWIVTQEKRAGKTYLALHRLELTKEETASLLKAAKP